MKKYSSQLMGCVILIAVLTLILIISGTGRFSDSGRGGFFQITMIDVGKGDCILVQTGTAAHPYNVLIDTGYKETAQEVLHYLKDHGVNNLDAMIISHFHIDHTGGAAAILSDPELSITKVYMPDYDGTREVYKDMMDVLTKEDSTIPYERLTANTDLSIGDAVIRLYPSTIEFDGDNDNDLSMAALWEYDGHSVLFAGDLEEEGIRLFLEGNDIPPVDILKLPHHGTEEKNTPELLDKLKEGGLAVITDGQEKRAYGTLIRRLDEEGYTCISMAEAGTTTITYDAAAQEYRTQKTGEQEMLTNGDWAYVLTQDNQAAITDYSGSGLSVEVPSEIDGYPVKAIGDSAFYNKDITGIAVPAGVTEIGASAFSWCTDLTDISIPDSVERVGAAAFMWDTKLDNVEIPDSVQEIGKSAFESCSNLKNIHLSQSMTEIAPSLFERCDGLEQIELPEGLQVIGYESFKRCTALKSVQMQKGLIRIDEGAFKRCESLERIEIPDGVVIVDASAFENCKSLKNVTLPVSVTELGKEAFRKCKELTDIQYAGTEEEWDAVNKGKRWDEGTPDDLQVHFPD
ncbi:MAG: leucine-rich repeat protein [Lachnospiraceae bacterium]|nr:leucine-rich repeat protein [Lachnospiraceae bacterium]